MRAHLSFLLGLSLVVSALSGGCSESNSPGDGGVDGGGGDGSTGEDGGGTGEDGGGTGEDGGGTGEDGGGTGCTSNDACPATEYCELPGDMCRGTGECAPRPTECAEIFAPVCGCDLVTYDNDCSAAGAGVNVVAEGECPSEGCVDDTDCRSGEVCAYAFGRCGGIGRCEGRPAGCPDVWMPVCGCDGVTYGNRCEALTAGASVASEGECAEGGCLEHGDCDEGELCAREAGACSGPGECATRPTACDDVFDPVCGCDGATYGNACEAAAAGVGTASAGECAVGGCDADEGCAARTEFCRFADGVCGGAGECTRRPEGCPGVFDPVCGCDGGTYGNACEAAASGVSVARDGACDVTAGCRSSEECARGELCYREIGMCSGTGACRARPDACPDVIAPVCGCDGSTYDNECEATRAGVTVAARGACGVTTGCRSNADCDRTAYCAREVGRCTATGMCHARPDACPDVFDPVCGCDGRTYGNACEAASAGVSVARRGACGGTTLGCTSDDMCLRGQYCMFPAGECGGRGACADRSEICPGIFAPVCGCDGRTYGNACEAGGAGVSVAHDGPCEDRP